MGFQIIQIERRPIITWDEQEVPDGFRAINKRGLNLPQNLSPSLYR